MTLVGAGTLSSIAYADALTYEQREKLTPDNILALMKKGNKRFYTGQPANHNFLAQQRASAKGQHPAAVLLSCIDSRASAETIIRCHLQLSRGGQRGKFRYAWQHGVRLQAGWGQGGSGHGPYGVRRH